MAYLDNNGLSHLWSKIVNLFNKRIEVSETAPTEEENKIWLQPLTTNAGAVDYIVDEGISGIWTYRKWNSGIAECWGSYTTTGGSSTEGSLYWIGTSTTYPSGLFISTPITEAILQGNWIGGILNSDSHSKDSFVGYVWTALNTSSYNFIINIRATGRWK